MPNPVPLIEIRVTSPEFHDCGEIFEMTTGGTTGNDVLPLTPPTLAVIVTVCSLVMVGAVYCAAFGGRGVMLPADAPQVTVGATAVNGDVTAVNVVVSPEKRAVFTGDTRTASMCTSVTVVLAVIEGFFLLLAVKVTVVSPGGIRLFDGAP